MPPENPDQDQKARLDFIIQTELEKPKGKVERLRSKSGLALGAIVLILISVVAIFMAASSNKANNEQSQRLISIAQTQTEIIRISSLAQSQAKDDATKSRADEITEKISASLEDIKSILTKNDVKIDDTNFNAKKNPETDSALVDALQKNEFDDTFNSIIEQNLLDYQQQLLDAQQSADNSDKPILEKAYNQANEILGISDQG